MTKTKNSKEVTAAIASWIVSESNDILERLNDGASDKTPVDTGFAKSRWAIKQRITKVGQTGVIKNDANYIGWLEYGSDTVDEHAMVRRTIQEVQQDYK